MNIYWNEQHKIRIRESKETQQKHLVVKALIMLHIKIKHSKELRWIRLYSEFPTNNGKISDIYYENEKTKEAIAYEIQKNISPEWTEKTVKEYEGWEVYGIKTADLIIVDLNKLSDDLNELGSQIKEIVI